MALTCLPVNWNFRIAMGLAAFGWGSGAVASRAALLEGAEPLTIVAMQLLIGGALVATYALLVDHRLPSDPQIWRRGSILGVLTLGVSTMLFVVALQYVSAGYQSLIVAMAPLMTAVLAHFILHDEPLHTSTFWGLLVGLFGVAVLVLSSETGIGDGGNARLGGILTTAGLILVSLGGVFARRFAPLHRVIDLGVPQGLAGAIIGFIGAMALGGIHLADLSPAAWLLIVYTGVIGTAVPFLSFLWASQHASATRVATIGYIIPVVSIAGGLIFIDELLTPMISLGGALIMTSIVMVNRLGASKPA